MNTKSASIPIRIHPVEADQEPAANTARQRFWTVLKRQERYSDRSITSLEAELKRELGPYLRNHLLAEIKTGIQAAEEALYGNEVRNILSEYRHFFFHGPREWPSYYPTDPITKLIEFRQQVFQDLPAARAALERLLLASEITFSVRIDGYSSLNLSLLVTQLDKVAQIFDSDFETFRVFLDMFVPRAFADTFDSETADQMTFEVAVPASVRTQFEQMPSDTKRAFAVQPAQQTAKAAKAEPAQRAEWLWKLANGSLLVPVLLALIVMYFGFKEVIALRTLQQDSLKPLLQHQLELLKEDRERFAILHSAIPAAPISPPASVSEQAVVRAVPVTTTKAAQAPSQSTPANVGPPRP